MSASKTFFFFIFLFLLVLPMGIMAQSRSQLEKKRKQKEEEIKLTKKILDQTRSKKKETLGQLNVLDKQIKIREELIGAMGDEILVIDGQIQSESATVKNLESELKRLKDEYADMIYRAYKMREGGDLTSYVLAAGNFNQALKRIQYIRQIGDDRQRQLELIAKMKDSITGKVEQLKRTKNEKNELLGQKEIENVELKGDMAENQKLVKSLQVQEKELKIELEEKKKAAKKLDDQIRKLIQDEINKANEEEKKRNPQKNTTNKKEVKSGEMALTPESEALAKEFGKNKGKLPWPTERGVIIRKFGTYAHPDLKGITIVNNGVDIVTTKGSQARAVMDGEVRSVFSIPGMQKAVMVKHGNYFTVYAHLDQVLVNRGDKVKAMQKLGTIQTNNEEAKTILHFEVWQNSNNLNPENWLAN